ncbi:hypothetical protein JAO76_08010 [Pontibacter sp. BT310]|uniref:Tetratricopeptide repeat protein n=1 Tax=Pontibacter populi TaxID=890055 RepID=A0ABS6XBX1_9BACT|nr:MULTISPECIES: DUF6340 family protein [Pontibacter]MBJ6118130.1 hypothetical protein [Pontibacter sp. BT310]MBR0570557.1 hypothetical protein [Microvirga sp. STS03]MBW3364983.1 hypothetical protein [Pontibacter populi]
MFSGCSKHGYVKLDYPLPPQVYLPDDVQTIALVNRSLTRPENKQGKVLEAIVTGEVLGSDHLASDECLKGVIDRINGHRSIQVVIPQRTRLYGTGTRQTPELLDWEFVKTICDASNADALLVLETFDSNSDVLLSTVTNGVTAALGNKAPIPGTPSQIRVNVHAFWRLYDPASRTILDQHQAKSFLTFNGATGSTLTLPPPEALPNTAYEAGRTYIERFLPGYYTVERKLYKKGKGSSKHTFKAAFRSSEVANWQGAINSWTALLSKVSRKNAGMASLNIAVAHEVLGNTDQALEWAKKSYEVYGNKLGRDYAKILLHRKSLE